MYMRIKPDQLLKDTIHYSWILDTSDHPEKSSHYLIPEVNSFILLIIEGTFRTLTEYSDQLEPHQPLLIAGLKRPIKVATSETLIMVGVSLLPGQAKVIEVYNPHTSQGFTPLPIPLPEMPRNISPSHYLDSMQTFIRERLRTATARDDCSFYVRCLNALSHPGCRFNGTCRYHGCSLRQLERFSFEYTGYSPREYIAVRTCSEARKRIRTGTYNNLTDLAMDLGFCDQSHFSKTFKRWTGMSPGAYKRYWEHVKELFLKEANNSSTLW